MLADDLLMLQRRIPKSISNLHIAIMNPYVKNEFNGICFPYKHKGEMQRNALYWMYQPKLIIFRNAACVTVFTFFLGEAWMEKETQFSGTVQPISYRSECFAAHLETGVTAQIAGRLHSVPIRSTLNKLELLGLYLKVLPHYRPTMREINWLSFAFLYFFFPHMWLSS